MEKVVSGIARGFINGEKQPLKGANICASYFNGTPYDSTSSKYCTSSDRNGNFTVAVPEDFYNLRMTYVGQKPLIIDLDDFSDFCVDGKCQINLTSEEGNEVLPDFTLVTPSGSKKPNWKKIGVYGGGAILGIVIGIYVYKKVKG